MKRVPTAELLDLDSGTPSAIALALRDLDHINRWFGGISTSQALVMQVAQSAGLHRITMLEVAAGSGNTSRAVQRRLSQRGFRMDLTLLDRAPSHLASGSDHGSCNGPHDGPRPPMVPVVAGDALTLPFGDNSFDVVSSNLFVHHLTPKQTEQFIREGLRVCRHALVINDVSRSWLHLGLVYLGLPLFRSRITWNDAPASVRQAYRPKEIEALLTQSSACGVDVRSRFLFRMGAIAWKSRVEA
ncbi:MAG: methyltransferase domain-containing protein [Terriglobales bacterium]|jgi:ubiquinone/menaquinone biosynthesis C-methylase UbiE